MPLTLPIATTGLTAGHPSEAVIGSGRSIPPGIESILEYRGNYLNVRGWEDTFLVVEIDGLGDADIRDAREVNPGSHGETPMDAFYGGRTLAITGRIRAHRLDKLRDMQQGLRQMFADIQTEYPLVFSGPDPLNDVMLYCKKSAPIQMREVQSNFGYTRDFLITLRASNPRFLSRYTQFAQYSGFRSDNFGVPATVDRRNYVQNPTLAINATQWAAGVTDPGTNPTTGTGARVTTDGFVGSTTASYEFTHRWGHSVTGTPRMWVFPQNYTPAATVQAQAMPVTVGQVVALRGSFKTVTALPTGGSAELVARWHDSAGNLVSEAVVSGTGAVPTSTNPAANTWVSLYGTATAPASAAYCIVRLNIYPTTSAAALPAPATPTVTTSTTGGTLAAGTYFYKVTALNARGETIGSSEASVTTTGTTSSNTITWTAVTGATGYRVYRGTATGAQNVYYAPGNVTSFTDTGAAATAGTVPTSDTTGYLLTARFDGFLVSEASSTTDFQAFFDGNSSSGSTVHYRWAGVPHLSNSERVSGAANLGFDQTLWSWPNSTTLPGSVMPSGAIRFSHNFSSIFRYDGYGVAPPINQRVTVKVRTPADLTQIGYVGPLVKFVDISNYAWARFNWVSGSTSIVRIYVRIAGTETNVVSTANFTVAASTDYWVRLQIIGNVLTTWIFSVDPALNPGATAIASASVTLTTAQAAVLGAGIAAPPGFRTTAAGSTVQSGDFEVDEFRSEMPESQGLQIFSAINSGNFGAQPQLQISGPVTNPVIRFINGDTQAVIGAMYLTGTIAGGDTWFIDIAKRTIVDQNGVNKFTSLSIASDWPEFVPGSTLVQFDGTSMDYRTTVVAMWRHTWI